MITPMNQDIYHVSILLYAWITTIPYDLLDQSQDVGQVELDNQQFLCWDNEHQITLRKWLEKEHLV